MDRFNTNRIQHLPRQTPRVGIAVSNHDSKSVQGAFDLVAYHFSPTSLIRLAPWTGFPANQCKNCYRLALVGLGAYPIPAPLILCSNWCSRSDSRCSTQRKPRRRDFLRVGVATGPSEPQRGL